MQSLTAKVIPLQTRRASRLTTQTFTQSLDVKGRGGEIDMRFHRVALEADGSTGNGMRQRDEPMRESIRSGGVTCRGVPTRSTFNDCFSRGRQANYIRDISSAVRCVCFLGRFSGGGRAGGGMAARCRVSVPAPGSGLCTMRSYI
jgi:hypothetical protein